MQELHRREQYFFDGETLEHLAAVVGQYARPVLLCTPMLGQYLHERGRDVTILDLDMRFADLPGFRRWDIHRPERLEFKPDLILCDPPFHTVKLDRLFRAVRLLADNDFQTPLGVSWLVRRQGALLGTFGLFGLEPTGYRPSYVTVPERVEIEFYGRGVDFSG